VRHQLAMDSQGPFASVPGLVGTDIARLLVVEFDEKDGLKNRRLASFSFQFRNQLLSFSVSNSHILRVPTYKEP
jgi:hypothetical protein